MSILDGCSSPAGCPTIGLPTSIGRPGIHLCSICVWLILHYRHGRPLKDGCPVTRYRTSGCHRMSDTYAVRLPQRPHWLVGYIYSTPTLVRVDHFITNIHKNTSA